MEGKNESKHTPPLPWVYTEDEKAEMFSIHTAGIDPVDGPNEFIACGIWYQSAGSGKAIAELIVTSVNHHEALRAEVDRLTKEKSDTIKLLADVYESVEQNGTIYEALEKKVIILIK